MLLGLRFIQLPGGPPVGEVDTVSVNAFFFLSGLSVLRFEAALIVAMSKVVLSLKLVHH